MHTSRLTRTRARPKRPSGTAATLPLSPPASDNNAAGAIAGGLAWLVGYPSQRLNVRGYAPDTPGQDQGLERLVKHLQARWGVITAPGQPGREVIP